jgi:hypothetical protein
VTKFRVDCAFLPHNISVYKMSCPCKLTPSLLTLLQYLVSKEFAVTSAHHVSLGYCFKRAVTLPLSAFTFYIDNIRSFYNKIAHFCSKRTQETVTSIVTRLATHNRNHLVYPSHYRNRQHEKVLSFRLQWNRFNRNQ